MCDLNFFGTLSSHRKSEKHQQLKTFLHPRCIACVKEFPSRIEYDEHCLTPQHMKNAVNSEEQRRSNKKKGNFSFFFFLVIKTLFFNYLQIFFIYFY